MEKITRRSFLGATSVAATGLLSFSTQRLVASPTMDRLKGEVKITDVKTAVINLKYQTTLVKVTTDSGLYGIGEAFPKADVADDIHHIKGEILGEDPLQVEVLYDRLTAKYISRGSRTGVLCGAIAGIETALWDLAGKILEVPVYTLLGGAYRNKVLLYVDADSPSTNDPQLWADIALQTKTNGYRALKHSLRLFEGPNNGTIPSRTLREWTRIMELSREVLGPDYPLGIDLHWKYHSVDVLRFTEMIKDLNIWFLEDPIHPEDVDGSLALKMESRVPILTGENLYTRHGFKPYIEKQACDMVHPDAQKCGGLLETKKIADWAELYSMPMLCHSLASPVGIVASGHMCLAIKSCVGMETDDVEGEQVPYWQDVIKRNGPLYKDGYLEISDKPGFGIELNDEVCKAHPADDRGFFE